MVELVATGHLLERRRWPDHAHALGRSRPDRRARSMRSGFASRRAARRILVASSAHAPRSIAADAWSHDGDRRLARRRPRRRRPTLRHVARTARAQPLRLTADRPLGLNTAGGPASAGERRGVSQCLNAKLGSVTYREVGQDYFDKRGLRRHAGVCVPLGARRRGRDLRRLLRLELRPRRRRLRRPPDRDGVIIAVMYYGLCYSIAEMSPALPAHGRRVFVRPFGDGSVGRIPHRPGREHGVRHHAGRGRRRDRVC